MYENNVLSFKSTNIICVIQSPILTGFLAIHSH